MTTGISWLDVKLGARMLVRNPALTIVGGLGLAVAVALSAGFFSFMRAQIYPVLPLEEGRRIVALENRDSELNNEDRRVLHDFFTWREELRMIEDIGAFRHVRRNVSFANGAPEAVQIAEVTAAGFTVPRVPPLLGRYLQREDEAPGAAAVITIGYDVWQNRFAGASDIVGRTIRIAGEPHTIVGVMPEGFAFPQYDRYWTPLRAQPEEWQRRDGPELFVFGRLADGVDMRQAQAELAAVGQRTAAAYPETHASIQPIVMPYVHSLTDVQGITFGQTTMMQVMMTLLLLIVALNVAVLVYARTAARQREIAVRSALGASRGRVVTQLFVEALVLALVSALVGLGIAQFGIELADGIMAAEMGGTSPFWVDYGIRPEVLLFTVGLAVLAAAIIGVLPGLRATRVGLQQDLRQLGGATMSLGRMWTGLIVAQVALAVALLPAAIGMAAQEVEVSATRATYAADEFITVGLGRDPSGSPSVELPGSLQYDEVMQRLEAEPGVAGVTYRARLVDRSNRIEVDGVPAPSPSGHSVSASGFAPDMLDVFGIPVLAGRGFRAADADANVDVVVVNEAFVKQILGGQDALGRRIRHLAIEDDDDGENSGGAAKWFEIVGVVGNMNENSLNPALVTPAIGYPVSLDQVSSINLVVRMRPGSTLAELAPLLRAHADAVDPTLRLGEIRSMAESDAQQQFAMRLIALIVSLVLISVLLLSAAGIYALMAFTVTQRRREIGIRSALGAPPGQVLRSVFTRAAGQIGGGVAIGVIIASAAGLLSGGESLGGRGVITVPALALTMLMVGLLAAVGPARRGLSIEPAEALRADS